jgi:hypothetical protein
LKTASNCRARAKQLAEEVLNTVRMTRGGWITGLHSIAVVTYVILFVKHAPEKSESGPDDVASMMSTHATTSVSSDLTVDLLTTPAYSAYWELVEEVADEVADEWAVDARRHYDGEHRTYTLPAHNHRECLANYVVPCSVDKRRKGEDKGGNRVAKAFSYLASTGSWTVQQLYSPLVEQVGTPIIVSLSSLRRRTVLMPGSVLTMSVLVGLRGGAEAGTSL